MITCSWCETVNRDASLSNCTNCGGPLPPPPGRDPGGPPPPAPRELPVKYQRRIRYWKNVLVLVGVFFSVFFCWTLFLPLIGIPMWYFGHKKAEAQLRALTHGKPARAELIEVYRDTSVQINGRSPWAIVYNFALPDGRVIEGRTQGWEPENGRRQPGEPHWVVYMPDDPRQNALWPPIR